MQVLRSDELSSNGDLYKRTASCSSTNASNYKLDGCGCSSAASSNVAGDVGNGSNGHAVMNGKHENKWKQWIRLIQQPQRNKQQQ